MRAAAWTALGVLYLATRLALLHRLPYFIDEGTYGNFVLAAGGSPPHVWESLRIGKEPLLAWLAVPPVKLGVNPLDALRLVSILAGGLTLPVTARLGAFAGGTAAGIVAALGVVVLPFCLVHDAIGIVEPLLTLLTVAALLVQIDLARHPRIRTGVLLGALGAVAVLAKQSGEAAIALLPASLLLFDFSAPGRRERLLRFAGAGLIAVALTVCGELLPHVSSLYRLFEQVRRSQFLYPVHSLHDALAHPLRWWQAAEPIYRSALTGYVGVPVLVLALAGWVILLRRQLRLALLLTVWIIALGAAAILFPVAPYPRHILYLVPFVSVLAAVALVALARITSLRGRRPPVAAVAASAVGLATLIPPLALDARVLAHPATTRYPSRDDVQYVTGPQAGQPWPAVVRAIRRRSVGDPTTIIADRSDLDIVKLLLADPRRYRVVEASAPAALRGQFIVSDELPFPDPQGAKLIASNRFRLLMRLPRPRGGSVVRVFVRR